MMDRSTLSGNARVIKDMLAEYLGATDQDLCLGGVIVEGTASNAILEEESTGARFARIDRTVRVDLSLLPGGVNRQQALRDAVWPQLCQAADIPGDVYSSEAFFSKEEDPASAFTILCASRAKGSPLKHQVAALCESDDESLWLDDYYAAERPTRLPPRTRGSAVMYTASRPLRMLVVAGNTAFAIVTDEYGTTSGFAAFDIDGTLLWEYPDPTPLQGFRGGFDSALAIGIGGEILELSRLQVRSGTRAAAGPYSYAAQTEAGWILGGTGVSAVAYTLDGGIDLAGGDPDVDFLQNIGTEVWMGRMRDSGAMELGRYGEPLEVVVSKLALTPPILWRDRAVSLVLSGNDVVEVEVPLDPTEPSSLVDDCESALLPRITDAGARMYETQSDGNGISLAEILP